MTIDDDILRQRLAGSAWTFDPDQAPVPLDGPAPLDPKSSAAQLAARGPRGRAGHDYRTRPSADRSPGQAPQARGRARQDRRPEHGRDPGRPTTRDRVIIKGPGCRHTDARRSYKACRMPRQPEERMTDQAALDWPTCDEDGCIGVRLAATPKCLTHAPDEQRKETMKKLTETGEIDVRGVPITEALLEQILAAAPHDSGGPSKFAAARFDLATFEGDAQFGGITFQGRAGFSEAMFGGHARFDGATFQGRAGFSEASFRRDAQFGGATFQGRTGFGGASFRRNADFGEVTFHGPAGFGEATFGGDARFDKATFESDARFDEATFRDPAEFSGATFQDIAWFKDATFQEMAWFDDATFRGDTDFSKATFWGNAWFSAATFRATAFFGGVTFRDDVAFHGVTFGSDAGFHDARFQATAWFVGATFQGDARFREASFQGDAWFGEATFEGDSGFDEATFQGMVEFDGATFQGTAGFGGMIVRRDAGFVEAKFEQVRQLGPLLVYGLLRLDGAHFTQLILIEAGSRGLSCQRARFPAGVQFRLRGAQVVLDDADLSSPSLIAGVDTLSDARLARRERRLVQAVRRLAPAVADEYREWPRLLSVQGANLAGLGVGNIDLAQCRFAGAHNLDKLRFEAEVSFATAPTWLPWDWRQVLAEERAWRATRSNRWAAGDWWPAWLHVPYRTEWPLMAEPAQLTGLYRALRKAREDAKDEPGAADFYYGEMEMRRHARRGRTGGASRGRVERAALTAYWLVSGYGLRAWRALAALAVVLVSFAGLLVWEGYEDAGSSPDARPASTSPARPSPSSSTAAPARPSARTAPTTTVPTSPTATLTAPASPATSVTDRSLVGALLYGARTIIGLNPTPAPVLTRFGEVLLITVRVLGPLLLGLALLALRGRVKR
jgi:hypothetical protein